VGGSTYLSIIAPNANGLNSSTKRCKLAEWILKTKQNSNKN
jgi:hypothetical protein